MRLKKKTMEEAAKVAAYPAFCSIDDWCVISGMGRRWVYDAIGRGNLRAIKCGSRTLIDVQRGLTYMNELPLAQIKPDRSFGEIT